jgi:acyl carrier protein
MSISAPESLDTSDATSRLDALVCRHFEGLGLAAPQDPQQDLRDAGLTSLQLVDLVFALEDDLGVTLPPDLMTPDTFRSRASIAAALTPATLRKLASVSHR